MSYSGKGIKSMLDCCKRNGLTKDNSILTVKDPDDLDSKWNIRRIK